VQRAIVVLVWVFWSGFIAAGTIYLGANTEPYRARWPLAGLAGAAFGGTASFVSLKVWRSRLGVLVLGVPVGLVLGIGASLLFSGK
jgi:hypothetical protein